MLPQVEEAEGLVHFDSWVNSRGSKAAYCGLVALLGTRLEQVVSALRSGDRSQSRLDGHFVNHRRDPAFGVLHFSSRFHDRVHFIGVVVADKLQIVLVILLWSHLLISRFNVSAFEFDLPIRLKFLYLNYKVYSDWKRYFGASLEPTECFLPIALVVSLAKEPAKMFSATLPLTWPV